VISLVGTVSGKSLKFITICHFLNLKCAKFDFGWGSTPDPAGGAITLLRPPAIIRGWGGTGRATERWIFFHIL